VPLGKSFYGGELRCCVGGEVDLMVYEGRVWIFVSEAKVSGVGACAEGDYLLRGCGRIRNEFIDEVVDGGGADVGSWAVLEAHPSMAARGGLWFTAVEQRQAPRRRLCCKQPGVRIVEIAKLHAARPGAGSVLVGVADRIVPARVASSV